MTKPLRYLTILLAAGLAATVVGSAPATPRALQQATNTCWRDVVNDWIQHQPNILGTYPIPCYTQAIQHLNAYPDVAGYSSAPDDIHNALLAAVRNDQGDGGAGGGGGGSSSGPGGGGTPPTSGNPSSGGGGSPSSNDSGGGFLGLFGAHDATSIPLPLIILGSLAILLALVALATWLARRIQTRRPAPAPVVSRRR
jgi:uncharacterized membrane protein YgcG